MKQRKLNQNDVVNKLLHNKLIVIITEPTNSWTEKNGIIYFTITSDGTSGKDWIARLESKGFKVTDYTKSVLLSEKFKPAKPTVYKIAVLKGEIFSNNKRITKNIRKEAKKRGLLIPNAEIACLIREKFSDKNLKTMGLYWIVNMHEPIKNSNGRPGLLGVYCSNNNSWLIASYDKPNDKWSRSSGFAFVVSQTPIS